MLITDLSLFSLSTTIQKSTEFANFLKVNSWLFSELNEDNTASPQEARINLFTLNEELQNYVILLSILSALLLISLVWISIKLIKTKKKLQSEKQLEEEEYENPPHEEDLEQLQEALNKERAKIIKHEVQKKELLAYIEELKASRGQVDLRHKTIQIQRIFDEHTQADFRNNGRLGKQPN